MPIFCKGEAEKVEIVGIEWYDGSEGYIEPSAPSLAVCFSNGKVQLMRNEHDESTLQPLFGT